MSDAIEPLNTRSLDHPSEVSNSSRGFWAVSTLSGTTYLLDLDQGVVLRQSVSDGEVDHGLRRDAEPLRLMSIGRCAVGESMLLIIDLQVPGVDFTTRRSTPVTRIQRLSGLVSEAHSPGTSAIPSPFLGSVAGSEGQECGN